ncbi:MAG: hypothetical protein JWQ96_2955 [Segetibacter sp.]|nr:hypothetical protein [Segetibacter sp.]
MHLLYITFGENVFVHAQAAYSIYSFISKKEAIRSINVITDSPTYYNHIGSAINILPIDEKQLEEWKGPHDFFWRIKIKALQKVSQLYAGEAMVYLDTDTLLYSNIDALQNVLAAGHAIMHEDEGPLEKAVSKTEKKMWKQVKERTFGGVIMTGAKHMWNAGVVGTPNTKAGTEYDLALNICDEMCAAGVKRRLIEQFALSTALSEVYGIKPAEEFIAHYWSNKEEWEKHIAMFFTEAYAKGYSTEEAAAVIEAFDFAKIPVKKRIKNTAVRLHALVDKLVKPREEVYLIKR